MLSCLELVACPIHPDLLPLDPELPLVVPGVLEQLREGGLALDPVGLRGALREVREGSSVALCLVDALEANHEGPRVTLLRLEVLQVVETQLQGVAWGALRRRKRKAELRRAGGGGSLGRDGERLGGDKEQEQEAERKHEEGREGGEEGREKQQEQGGSTRGGRGGGLWGSALTPWL